MPINEITAALHSLFKESGHNPEVRDFFNQLASLAENQETRETPLSDDPLIPDTELRKLLYNCSSMTIWRYRKAGLLPPPIVINKRNYSRKSVVGMSIARIIGENHPQAQQAA